MTSKQFTALVVSICITVMALIFFGLAIGASVTTSDVSDRFDTVTEEHGPLGTMAAVAYMAMSGFLVFLCGVGMFLHSAVGLMTAIAAVRAEGRGARITSIVLISLNGVMLLAVMLLFLLAIVF